MCQKFFLEIFKLKKTVGIASFSNSNAFHLPKSSGYDHFLLLSFQSDIDSTLLLCCCCRLPLLCNINMYIRRRGVPSWRSTKVPFYSSSPILFKNKKIKKGKKVCAYENIHKKRMRDGWVDIYTLYSTMIKKKSKV
jgi:hypothetical protein